MEVVSLIKRQSCHYKETSQLICCADQLIGFYLMAILAFHELKLFQAQKNPEYRHFSRSETLSLKSVLPKCIHDLKNGMLEKYNYFSNVFFKVKILHTTKFIDKNRSKSYIKPIYIFQNNKASKMLFKKLPE